MARRTRTEPEGAPDAASPSPAPSVVLDGIEARRGSRVVLRNVTFALEPGTLTAVVGPNGAGKSSLFGVLSGRLKPTTGTLELGGPVAEVLQNSQINEYLRLTVNEVVGIGRYRHTGLLRLLRAGDREIIDDALQATDLVDLRRRSIHELSGGQRQRALVAQGLAQRAPILLLDEPTAGLDVRSQREVVGIMQAEAARGTTVVFATHDLSEAAKADNLIVLACDCLCCAPPRAALTEPAVTELFGQTPGSTWETPEPDARPPATVGP